MRHSYSAPRLIRHGTVVLRTLTGLESSAEEAGVRGAANTQCDASGVPFDGYTIADTTNGVNDID
jgi:hypothetical protein